MKRYIAPEFQIENVNSGDVLTLSASFYDDCVTAPDEWFNI